LGTLDRPAFKLNLTEALCVGVLRLQMLSYHMCVMRGFDPDFPRNLSKKLTVD
jgi:glucosamine--fructose-6-phosphate aminotransferase (isomerizing)